LYFNAKGIETEIREMMTYYGLTDIILADQQDIVPAEDEKEPKPPVNDIPPQQKKLWDDQSVLIQFVSGRVYCALPFLFTRCGC
jgi:hypothetical protein